jgi:hypothetical protein
VSRKKHEDWTIAALAVASPSSELEQEWSVPRGVRRIDVVHQWEVAPEHFGQLRAWLSHRTVLVEHESTRLLRGKWWSLMLALAWLRSIWFGRHSGNDRAVRERMRVGPATRAPVLLIVAEKLAPSVVAEAGHLYEPLAPGIWVDGDPDRATTVVLDGSRLRPGPDTAFWYFLLGPGPTTRYDVLTALTLDPSISMELIKKLQDAVANQTIPATDEVRLSVGDQLRKEGRLAGEREGRREGRREELLHIAARIARNDLARLEAIEDLDELRAAVTALLDV